jgi:TonB-dependent receptor
MWNPAIVRSGTCTGTAYKCASVYNNGTVNSQREDTLAGYFVLNFAHEPVLFGKDIPIDGNIGVRLVDTMYDSGPGQLKLPNVTLCGPPLDASVPAGSDRAVSCTFVGTQNNSTTTYPGITHDYLNVLPSFNLRAGLTDQILVRLGYSQGLVRPDLDKMRNYTQLGYAWGTMTQSNSFAVSNPLTGTGSNPYLKPTYSQNYDVSLEWYFSPSDYVSAAFFYKTVGNYVMSGYAPMTFTRNGVTQTFTVGSYVNGGKGTVKGFELAYQQFYDFLPGALSGLGFQANYTKIWNDGGRNPIVDITQADSVAFASDASLPMEGMSNDSYNVVAMYEKYDISARLAYNWRSKNLVNSYPANLFQPVFQKNYGQLDGSILYTLFDHYKVGLQASNILKQTAILTVGRTVATQHDYQWVEGERKLSLVLRATW